MATANVLLIATVLSVFGCAYSATSCPDGWIENAGSCYLFAVGHHMDFADAEIFCRGKNAHMLHVDDSQESAFLKSYISTLDSHYFSIGLTDANVEGQWRWTDDGTIATFTNWGHNEPNSGRGNEDCAAFRSDILWADVTCYSHFNPICEKK